MRLMGNGSENTLDDGRSMAAEKVIYIYIYAGAGLCSNAVRPFCRRARDVGI